MDQSGIHITTRKHALQRVRELVAPYVKEGVSMVDKLIADRRAESAKEENETQEWLASHGKSQKSDV
ncbi:hypothetical protein [Consotaella aegiceratis]|uniref:hypothetical protein n=1 Tax=Consotaella aegiceratis TaxID=3097961 RepID=UPI002F41E8DA